MEGTASQDGHEEAKLVYPHSLTGKGSGFHVGGSVLDHKFGSGDPYTLGV